MSSTLEWLREQQKRYVAKTPQQVRAEQLAMSFEQLRKRAGPPPAVFGCSFYDPSYGEGNSGGAQQAAFDADWLDFKKGLCPPPYPLYNASHDDAVDSGVVAYEKWFNLWGNLLHKKWRQEHPSNKPVHRKQPEHTIISVAPPKPVHEELQEVVVVQPMPQPEPQHEIITFEDVCAKFQQMWREDPLMDALNRGDINWGDLDLYDQSVAQWEKYHDELVEKRLNEPEPEPQPEPEPEIIQQEEIVVKQEAPSNRVVPPFTPGIRTIMARNLPRDITVEQLRSIFEKYGPLKDVYIPRNMDKNSIYFGTIKGFAKVEFLKAEHSALAFQEEYGRIVIGSNNVSIEFAKEDRAPVQRK